MTMMEILTQRRRGSADIIAAVILLTVAAIASYLAGNSTIQSVKLRLLLVNQDAGFYSGEMAAISALLKNQAAPLPDGKTPITNPQFNTGG